MQNEHVRHIMTAEALSIAKNFTARTDITAMEHQYLQLPARLLQALLILTIFGVAQAAPLPSDGSRLYAPCGVCHQPNAWGSPDGTIPNLAGQQKRYLEQQLALFRSGARV